MQNATEGKGFTFIFTATCSTAYVLQDCPVFLRCSLKYVQEAQLSPLLEYYWDLLLMLKSLARWAFEAEDLASLLAWKARRISKHPPWPRHLSLTSTRTVELIYFQGGIVMAGFCRAR